MYGVRPGQAEYIKQQVLDCKLRRFSAQETADYLATLGIPMDVRTVRRYRARIKESAQAWISKLARSRKADYIAQYKERIDEVLAIQRSLKEITHDSGASNKDKIEANAKLLVCTGQLVELYDSLPVLNAIRDYDIGNVLASNGNGNHGSDSGNGLGADNTDNHDSVNLVHNGGSCNRHCSDFPDEASRYRCDYHSQQHDLEKLT